MLNNLIKSPLNSYGWGAIIIDYVIGSKVGDVLLFFDRSHKVSKIHIIKCCPKNINFALNFIVY